VTTALSDLLARHVETGTIQGAVALLGRGDDVEVAVVGVASDDGRAMPADAIMRIQSMTKVLTAVAALRLVESGRLGLDQSVEEWLPELTNRRVLISPTATLEDTVPARRTITLRHLLTNASGYGMSMTDSPLRRAMADNGTEAGAEPLKLGADEWVARLTGRPLDEHLTEDLFVPLAMIDTALSVPEEKLDRLPAAYRHGEDGLVMTEPAGGGFYAGPPPFDVSHGEFVSTVADFHRFTRLLADGGRVNGEALLSAEHLQQMTSDRVPAENKTPDSFFPGFWDGMGWGFGVGVQTEGPQQGRYGWGGGQGTDFFVDRDGTIGILFTQVELGERMSPLLAEFQALHQPT